MEIAVTSKQIVIKQNLITSLSLDSKTIMKKSQEGKGRGGQGSVGELIILG